MTEAPTKATEHAVLRYIERHRPYWTFRQAQTALLEEGRTATFVEHPDGEDAIWRTLGGRLLVVRDDGTIRTVLAWGSKKPNRRPRK
jgi:hypothetical protein